MATHLIVPLLSIALAQTPSPLDKLDPGAIDADERKAVAIRELVALIAPHDRAVASVAVSSDGTLLASSGWDNAVYLHKLGGKTPTLWAKLDGSPSGIALSPDGKVLATGSGDTKLILWDLTGAKPTVMHELAGHKNRPFAVAFSPNGKRFASGSFNPLLRIWNYDDGNVDQWAAVTKEAGPPRAISSLAFSQDGGFVVAGSLLGADSLRIWRVSGSQLVERTLPPTSARVVACSPKEPIIAFAGDETAISLWNIGGANIAKLRQLAGAASVKALAFSADGKMLASAGQDKRVRLWNVATGKANREWLLHIEPAALVFASDSRHLIIGTRDGAILLLRLESAKMPVD